ncbi:hypothetical protein OOK41_04065 [Micromonospora sp. NBC_01655]|uniref:hypothetical protein n=1 Tax=Micromonospora sp. NBC_01655 TaxID=2975983 RepID=UPI0022592CC6|nr:hypothetical protein [Micromonospora sp. NBC_01655]MCX4469486.1 hypothetical protein [Micromonospora sp. NBC_01655]
MNRECEIPGILDAVCVGAGCRSREGAGRPAGLAEAGSRLCPSCLANAERDLRLLPALYDDCGQALGGGSGVQHERTSGGGTVPSMPFNPVVAEARATIVGVLGSWAGLVVTERRVDPPSRSATPLARFLLRHLRWVAAHPAAAEFSEEVAQLVRSARRAAYPAQLRQVRLGSCVEVGCTGQLVAHLRPHEPSPAEIRCREDPRHRWADHQWLELHRRMRRPVAGDAAPGAAATAVPGARWFTAADIARLWRVPSGTVYRLASEERWGRRSRAGRTTYLAADVTRTFDRRARRSADRTAR